MGRTQLQLAWRKLARGCEPSYSKSYSSLVSLFSYPLSTTEEFLWDGLALIRRNDGHFANESGYGNLEPSREEILNEIINKGYEDWEYVSDSFFWENHQSDIMGEGEFVYNVTLCWKIEIRKWEE